MANKYGIVRLDRVTGATPDGRLTADVDMENGIFVVQDEANAELVMPTTGLEAMVLVASVCQQYESLNEGDFINVKDSNLKPRTYKLEVGDIFTTTKFSIVDEETPLTIRTTYASIAKGDIGVPTILAANPGALCFKATAPRANTKITVEVIGKTTLNGDPAVQVKVLTV